MTTTRRTVHVSGLIPRTRKHGRHVKLWAYGYADIAALVGKSVEAVRQDAFAKHDKPAKFDPASLASVVAYISARVPPASPCT